MNRRLIFAKHWLFKKNNVKFFDLLSKLFTKTCSVKAKSFISSLKLTNNYYKIYFKKLKYPLFFPKDIPLHSLYRCVVEIFDKRNWHHYEINETTINSEDIVLDCGAAEGLFTLKVADYSSKVYAIEPLPQFGRYPKH